MQPGQLEILRVHITDAMISEKDCCPNEPCTKVYMGLDVEIQCNIGFKMKLNIEDLKNFNAI